MSTEQKVIPAALFSKFGIVNEYYKASKFKKNGHYLQSLTLSDISISPKEEKESIKVKLFGQSTKKITQPIVTFRFPTRCLVGISTMYYISENDSKRVDDLYKELVATCNIVFGGERTKEHRDNYNKRLLSEKYETVLFKVASMTTVNLRTKHKCVWVTGSFDTVDSEGKEIKDYRMKLTHVNGIESENLSRNELFVAAGKMQEDQCVVAPTEEFACAYKVEKKRNKPRTM